MHSTFDQGIGKVQDQASTRGPVRGERERSAQQVPRRVNVTALERGVPGASEAVGRAMRQPRHGRVAGVELRPVVRRLLEVVAHDLVLLDELSAGFEPVREALVELGADGFREALVRRVTDEEVAEAKCVVARDQRLVGSDELLADKPYQLAGHVHNLRSGCQGRHGAAVENLTFHRASLDHCSLPLVQRVEPGLEQGLNRRRHLDGPARFAGERGHLLEEQGFPSAVARMRALVSVSSSTSPRRLSASLDRFAVCERLEKDRCRVELAAAPAGPDVEQLGAGEAKEQDRSAARPVGDVLDEVEHRRTRPVEVVDDQHERLRQRTALEQRPRRKLRLRGRGANRGSDGSMPS